MWLNLMLLREVTQNGQLVESTLRITRRRTLGQESMKLLFLLNLPCSLLELDSGSLNKNRDEPVGPASYNTQTNFYNQTGISFTKDKQRLDSSLGSRKNPGPDRYFNLDRKKIKGGVIGTTKHLNEKIAIELTPGPGSYETLS
jgi:hypothetical protein